MARKSNLPAECKLPGHPNYNTEGLGGRPVEYDERYLDSLAIEFIEWFKHKDNVWYQLFFSERQICKQSVAYLRTRSAKLDHAINAAMDWQEGKIVDGAMKRRFSDKISLAALATNHGWKLSENRNVKIDATPEAIGLFGKIAPTENLVN
jgi:hypothetical protein